MLGCLELVLNLIIILKLFVGCWSPCHNSGFILFFIRRKHMIFCNFRREIVLLLSMSMDLMWDQEHWPVLLLKWSTSQDTCTVDVSRFLGKTPCTRIKSVMRTSSCTSELHWSQALCGHAIDHFLFIIQSYRFEKAF